ncbi:sodium- and chloride-dependent glycine transporter 2-like [Gigantopelta aegis]|uniref:sodium- and chloride-dependent glycine transporter 2-like n=1 Tax=Gigantopelta aegis TaxID=1735272 RepID=UPI001B88E3D4|nr:sodium- and chloride-dependent glycine transporter 2-like [Gigantopelta aegis]
MERGKNTVSGDKNNSSLYPDLQVVANEQPTVETSKSRETWSTRFEFLLSCLSYAVGLSNVWRFPYVCYKNGGGAFILPYMITLVVTGLPVVYLELCFGQFASEGVISIWKVLPIFKGVGWAMFIVSGIVCIYYNVIIAWTLYYLFASFAAVLPWSNCGSWSSPYCVEDRSELYNCSRYNGTWLNNKCNTLESVGEKEYAHIQNMSKQNGSYRSASDEYFHGKVLEMSEGWHDMGGVKWDLALYLLLSWVFVSICLAKGIKTSGKAVYFTTLFPYLVMSILFVRGLTLDGSADGLRYYLTPQWDKLGSAAVWSDAAVQVFFSLSPGMGGLITLASYNKYHNNCFNDAIIVTIIDWLTSIFAGLVIFTIIGYMAFELGKPISEVAEGGAGLAFVVYPEVVTKLPVSQLWAILFFSMLFTLGLGTQIVTVTTVHTTLVDGFPEVFRKNPRYSTYLLLALASFFCLTGLAFCSRGGMYLLQLFDNYAASYSLIVIVIVETLAISWIYGADRFLDDIMSMLGKRPSKIWIILWQFICPCILTVILIFTCANLRSSSYGDVTFPLWADVLGGLIALLSIVIIPIMATHAVFKEYFHSNTTLIMAIRRTSQPSADWGPRLLGDRKARAKFNTNNFSNIGSPPVMVLSETFSTP